MVTVRVRDAAPHCEPRSLGPCGATAQGWPPAPYSCVEDHVVLHVPENLRTRGLAQRVEERDSEVLDRNSIDMITVVQQISTRIMRCDCIPE